MYDAAVDADVVLAETPANPGLDVTDLHRLSLICRGRGARLIVDNTTATPLGQLPLSLGADLVVASATKALSGHSDLLAGYAAGSHPDLMETLARERLLSGPILGAFEAWLLLRSLGSAGLRFSGSATTPPRWRPGCAPTRRCGRCATRWRCGTAARTAVRRCRGCAAAASLEGTENGPGQQPSTGEGFIRSGWLPAA